MLFCLSLLAYLLPTTAVPFEVPAGFQVHMPPDQPKKYCPTLADCYFSDIGGVPLDGYDIKQDSVGQFIWAWRNQEMMNVPTRFTIIPGVAQYFRIGTRPVSVGDLTLDVYRTYAAEYWITLDAAYTLFPTFDFGSMKHTLKCIKTTATNLDIETTKMSSPASLSYAGPACMANFPVDKGTPVGADRCQLFDLYIGMQPSMSGRRQTTMLYAGTECNRSGACQRTLRGLVQNDFELEVAAAPGVTLDNHASYNAFYFQITNLNPTVSDLVPLPDAEFQCDTITAAPNSAVTGVNTTAAAAAAQGDSTPCWVWAVVGAVVAVVVLTGVVVALALYVIKHRPVPAGEGALYALASGPADTQSPFLCHSSALPPTPEA